VRQHSPNRPKPKRKPSATEKTKSAEKGSGAKKAAGADSLANQLTLKLRIGARMYMTGLLAGARGLGAILTIMKAISIRSPWAWAILHAGKDIENRSWITHTRGTVAIHASKTMSRPFYEAARSEIKRLAPRSKMPPYEAMSRSAIIGLVDIVDCTAKRQSKWHDRGQYGFVLAKPHALRRPIPCDGWLNFWEVPPNIARRILRQLK